MSSHHYAAYSCCAVASRGPDRKTAGMRIGRSGPHRPRRSFARRSRDFAAWALPGAILALLPKCPACLAAYIAFATGAGLSLPTASVLRISLMVLCVASLAYASMGQLRRRLARSMV